MSESDRGDGGVRSWLGRITDLFTGEPSDRKDLMEMLRDAADRQLLDGEVLNIIFGALTVSDIHARDIMIPRSQLVTVSANTRLEEFLPLIIHSKHSRFPVVGDDLDDVKGILHAKDLLPLLLEDDWDDFDIKDCIRPATVVPESKRLNVLLQEFRSTRNHMAVVVDEYGHISGAITIEDVLEQIVGDIEDEHDVDEESSIKDLDARNFTVKATTPIDEFNEYFDTDFDDDEFDTIGGLVLKQLGHLPKREETGQFGEFQFRVLSADSRRIRLLHMTRMEPDA
jgi:magnesium and cobalt transporter